MITSDQISAMTGNFQSQMMGQMQHASMISQQVGAHQTTGESVMGKAVNIGSSIGAPMLTGGLALAGLDPFSMGMRGAIGGGARMGMMGAIGGGMAGAGIAGGGFMAAQYAGSQMMTGMQQQQQLNAQLRQQYQFMGGTGRGFNSDQLGGIGQMMRGMSTTQGANGEFTSMDELGRMASSMGQMGMGGNIRNVRDFTEKFRSMMKEVKEVATAFHTSLEEAQQVVSSMRSSGVFSNQGQIAQQIKSTALSGGLATSEITSMMNIGSQISRSVGGRGQAGAMGGMRTIGQIGGAMQAGVLSEEDIYNATGLTGAEGRQAMASSMMQRSASFLRGGLGRRFLASVAGKDGSLDDASVEEYMHSGGIGTGDTMGMAYNNLGKVGRANFIRNEGRLRGSALEKFGGNVDLMVMKGWLDQRGMDSGSDRAKIFMSRRLGIGQEELDEQLKMLNNMPAIMKQQEMSDLSQNRLKNIESMQSKQGLSGLKKKFEVARNDINSYLQQAGAEFYQAGSNMLERWANEITGQFMTEMSENLEPAIQEVLKAGSGAEGAMASRFGMGAGLMGKSAGKQLQATVFGARKGMGSLEAASLSGDLKRFRNAGYGIAATTDASFQSQLGNIRGIEAAFQEGNSAVAGIGAANKDFLQTQGAMFGMKGGFGGQVEFGNMLSRSKDPKMQYLSLQYNQADQKQRAAIMGTVMREAGMGDMAAASAMGPASQSAFNMGGFRTAADRNSALGDYMLGGGGENAAFRNEKVLGGSTRGDIVGAAAGAGGMFAADTVLSAIPGLNVVSSALNFTGLKSSAQDQLTRSAKGSYEESMGGIGSGVRRAAGDYMMSESGQRLLRGALSRDEGVAGQAKAAMVKRMNELQTRKIQLQKEGGDLSDLEQGELEGTKSMHITQDFARLREEGMSIDEAVQAIAEKYKTEDGNYLMDPEDIKRRAQGGLASVDRDQENARRELMSRAKEHGTAQSNMFRRGGVLSGGKLSSKAIGQYGGIGAVEQLDVGKGKSTNIMMAKLGGFDAAGIRSARGGAGTVGMTTGQQFIAGMVGSAQALERINEFDSDDPRNADLMNKHLQLRRSGIDASTRMEDDELRDLQDAARGMGDLDTSRMVAGKLGMRKRLARAGGGQRGMVIAAEALGSSISRKDLMAFGTDTKGMAGALSKDLFGDQSKDEDVKMLQEALEAQKAGKTKEAEAKLSAMQSDPRVLEAQKSKQDDQAAQDDPNYRALGKIETAVKNIGKDTAAALEGLQVNVANIKDLKPEAE